MQQEGAQLEVGSVVAGYRIDGQISRGGMGVVYRATNLTLGQTYALKVLAPELAGDLKFRERFRREIMIAASLHHPHAVGVHYAGDHEGHLFLAMDFVDGTDLRDVIHRDGALEPDRAVRLLEQICSALDAAHAKGLVHRDVKPANVLITTEHGDEHAYLTDFGIAKQLDTSGEFTVKGTVLGTVDYMPPEQITGGQIDARSDVYALGAVFFQMLTGKVPFDRENTAATMFAHVYTPLPSLLELRAELPRGFDPVIAKAMAKEPKDRYMSAGDLARDARAALEGTRYTGSPTVVATGEARPRDTGGQAAAPETIPASPAEQAAARETMPPADSEGAAPPIEPTPLPVEPAAPPLEPAAVAAAAATKPADPSPAAPPGPTPAPPAPPAEPPGHTPAPPAPPAAGEPPSGSPFGRRRLAALVGAVAVLAAVGVVIAVSSGSSSSPTKPAPTSTPTVATGDVRTTAMAPVPDNRVTGAGNARVQLVGNVATVSLTTHGLLNGSPHAMHIHAGGLGQCPPVAAAKPHNGHLSISTGDGIHWYGPPRTALTSFGDFSAKSIIDFARYPTTGNITYTREMTLPAETATFIRQNNAAVIIHGIDYNGNGIYDDVLDRSDLSSTLPGEATAPALCGVLVPAASADAKSRGGRHAVVYTASLHAYAPATASQNSAWWYLCHLGGSDALAAESRSALAS